MEKRRIKIAVVGCGRVGKTHLEAIKVSQELFDLAAVVDIREDCAKKYAATFDTSYYTSLGELYNDSTIEAVVLCIPHDLHKSVSINCLNSGKHVLVEKPMAKTLEEAKEMVLVAKKSKKILMIGQSVRFFDAVRISKTKLTDIGKPFSMLYHWGSCFNESAAPPWWKSSERTGGLILPMSGSHAVDLIIWFYERKPISVYGKIFNNKVLWDGFSEASIIMEFGENEIATLRLSLTTKPVLHQVLINGPKGTLVMNHQEEPGAVGVGFLELMQDGNILISGRQEPTNFVYQIQEFGVAIKEEKAPIASGSEVLVNMEVLEAIEKSSQEKRPIFLQ